MVGNVLLVFHNSCVRRVSSIIGISSYVLCTFPQSAVCSEVKFKEFAADIATNISADDSVYLIEKFDALKEVFDASSKPLEGTFQFLQAFIEELNSLYGLNLTIDKACILVRNNLNNFQLAIEAKDVLFKTIDLLESNFIQPVNCQNIASDIERVSFTPLLAGGLLKWLDQKDYKSSKKNRKKPVSSPALQIDTTNVELPAEIYIGTVEMFAGVLVCTLGLVYFPAFGMGLGVMGDGARRVFSGLTDLGNDRREQLKPLTASRSISANLP